MRLALAIWLLCQSAVATSYFVDFSSGSDAANGTSTGSPWQHCPADANATGVPASASFGPGDVINFKGGVTYNGALGLVSSPNPWNGTASNPVTFQSAVGWGSGQAILDGTYNAGATTNGTCFLLGFSGSGSDYTIISGFEIRNYGHAAVLSKSLNTVLTNCLVHHIGYYPYNANLGSGQHGYGFYMYGGVAPTCASNQMYDFNENAVYIRQPTNIVIWGNNISNAQDHAVIGGVNAGWTLIAFNQIHDQTNQVTHDDSLQIQNFGDGTNCLIVANNLFWNNNQDIFPNLFINSGTAYIFGNLSLNNGSTTGNGDDGNFNGIVVETSNTGQNWSYNNLLIFNNTFVLKNGGSGAYRNEGNEYAGLNPSINLYFYNNLLYQSYVTGLGTTSPTNILNVYAGYNDYTNALRGPSFGVAGNEVNSLYQPILFAGLNTGNLPGSDYHLVAGSAAIASGTNLTTGGLISSTTFNFLPAAFAIDPTKDASGVARVSTWDIGALTFTHSLPPVAGLCCH